MSREAPSLLSRIRDRDHTQGSLLKSILALAIPAILASLGAFGTFQIIELVLIGRLGPEAVAAAGATNQTLRQAIFLVVIGLSTSSQMLIARRVGEGDVSYAERIAGQTLLAGVTLGLLAAVAGHLFAAPLVALVVQDAAVASLGVVYVEVAFVFLFLTIFVQLASGILGGAGDGTTPMLVGFLVTPLALLGQWALAFGHLGLPELGMQGIPLGAALGGAAGVTVLTIVLARGTSRLHLRRHHLRPDWPILAEVLRSAWQPSLHLLARTTIVFFFMFIAGRLGGSVQAAYTIGLRVEMLPIMVAFPVANACATLVGQNLGAGRLDRAWQAIRATFALQAILLWPMSAFIYFQRSEIVGIFGDDPQVSEMAAEYLGYSSVVLCFYGFYFTAFRALQAAGDMMSPMLISVTVALLLGVPLGWGLSSYTELGATGMWIANLVYALVNCTLMVGWLLRGHWAQRHQMEGAGPL